mgnify:CR=1 FL=1
MDGLQFFWLFVMFVALQPVLRQRWLLSARQKVVAKLERARGSRVISLVHRQETMSLLGFPVMRYIDIDDSEAVIDAINRTDSDVPIDIVLHTPGGLVVAAYQIARAIRRHRGRTTVFVPHHALSGGTLIALAADQIVMSPHAVLGPVDPQVGTFPAVSILKVLAKCFHKTGRELCVHWKYFTLQANRSGSIITNNHHQKKKNTKILLIL